MQLETLTSCQVKGWSHFVWLLALASVTGIAIHPETGCIAFGKFAVKVLNVVDKSHKFQKLHIPTSICYGHTMLGL